MADLTKIEWCDATLNLWWGCTKVSEGCKHCYADAWSKRHGRAVWGPMGTRIEVKSWRSTLEKISKRAKAEGRRLRVFCQSMSDTFEGPETMGGIDSENWQTVQRLQYELLCAINEHPHIDFLLLTKRPENVMAVVHREDDPDGVGGGPGVWRFPANLWIGTSVEDQKTADERIPHLLRIPAKVRFLSCEPLIGPVDLTQVEYDSILAAFAWEDRRINWVICGGESGPKARPMHPDWARSLRDQCVAAGVPFLFKQHGEWIGVPDLRQLPGGNGPGFGEFDHCRYDQAHEACRIGKYRAGRILDGRTWDEFPEVGL